MNDRHPSDNIELVRGGQGRTDREVGAHAEALTWGAAFVIAAGVIVGLTFLWAWVTGRIDVPLTLTGGAL